MPKAARSTRIRCHPPATAPRATFGIPRTNKRQPNRPCCPFASGANAAGRRNVSTRPKRPSTPRPTKNQRTSPFMRRSRMPPSPKPREAPTVRMSVAGAASTVISDTAAPAVQITSRTSAAPISTSGRLTGRRASTARISLSARSPTTAVSSGTVQRASVQPYACGKWAGRVCPSRPQMMPVAAPRATATSIRTSALPSAGSVRQGMSVATVAAACCSPGSATDVTSVGPVLSSVRVAPAVAASSFDAASTSSTNCPRSDPCCMLLAPPSPIPATTRAVYRQRASELWAIGRLAGEWLENLAGIEQVIGVEERFQAAHPLQRGAMFGVHVWTLGKADAVLAGGSTFERERPLD